MYVVGFEDIRKDAIEIAGGKGANLGEMFANGFPVPQGFCITSSAYEAFIRENHFSDLIESTLTEIYADPRKSSVLAEKLMRRIEGGTLPKEMYNQIAAAYHRMGDNVRVAIRSSATAEDLPEASFAGQQETYLNRKEIENVVDAVKKCFSSLWTDRAIAYRKKTGFDKQKISLAVVVQEMVEGDISGVLFTANPINRSLHEMMINASYGLGEAIVSGMVTPDSFVFDRNKDSVKQRILGSKDISVVYDGDCGTVQKINNSKRKEQYCISDSQIQNLAVIARKIEEHYGAPQDIEWAIRDGKVYILQSRGITTLKENTQTKEVEQVKHGQSVKKQNKRERMMMNNLIEHCPTPLYPLDFAPIYRLLQGKTITMEEIGVKITQKDALILKNNGEIVVHAPTIKVTPKILAIPFQIKNYRDFKQNISETQKVLENVKSNLKDMEALDKNNLSVEQLVEKLQLLMKLADKIIYMRFRYNIYPGVIVGKYINSHLKKMNPPVSQYDVLSELHYKTWDMNMSISNLAELINKNSELKKEIMSIENGENAGKKMEIIADKYPQFGSLYTKVMKEYGWKSTSTYLAFSSISWNEDKTQFLILLKIAMKAQNDFPKSSKYEEICNQIKGCFSHRKSQKLLSAIEETRTYHQNREESLYLLEQCYGISRVIVKNIARSRQEIFLSVDDILYLTLEEVYSLSKGSSDTIDQIKEKIKTRRQSMITNKKLWDLMQVQSIKADTQKLKGISGNTGKVKGKVCIIQDISQFDKLQQGDILVCKYTDPVWTPLFTIAKAVVSDTGGPLSHSAIVAREYHIPAVLGCGNATKILKDGQEIFVDADEGVVQILN